MSGSNETEPVVLPGDGTHHGDLAKQRAHHIRSIRAADDLVRKYKVDPVDYDLCAVLARNRHDRIAAARLCLTFEECVAVLGERPPEASR